MQNDKSLTKNEDRSVQRVVERSQLTDITYRAVLAKKPPRNVVKYHEFGKFNYLPITVVERMLDGLFAGWSVKILREGQVANGFYVVVRLTANIPQSDKQLVADGIGFAEFQTIKGVSTTDLSKIIQGAGVLAIPRAKAEAVKNAAKSFGNLFGRNLTRKDDNSIAEAEIVNKSRSTIANTLKGGSNNG